jgi:hypothetical protein
MRKRTGVAFFGVVLAALLFPALAGAGTVVPSPVKPQVVQPQVVTPAPAPQPVQAPAPAPHLPPPTPAPLPAPVPIPSPESSFPDYDPPSSPPGRIPGHPSRPPRPPDNRIFPPSPNLPNPEDPSCDAGCLQSWQDFLSPLLPKDWIPTGYDKLPGPGCDRDCLRYWESMLSMQKEMKRNGEWQGDMEEYYRELKEQAEELAQEKRLADAVQVLNMFGFNPFDPPRPADIPNGQARDLKGSVVVKEGPVEIDKGPSAPSSGATAKEPTPAGPPADDIGDWDFGLPFLGAGGSSPNLFEGTLFDAE